MNTSISFKRFALVSCLLLTGYMQSFAQSFNNVWVKIDVVPAGSGQVFADWYIDEVFYNSTSSEFKRTSNAAPSAAFVLTKPADGYHYAGLARDMNGNKQFDNDYTVDRLVHVWFNHFFTCFYDHTDYEVPGSSTASMELAEEALEQMTGPTDQLFAVFTQGAVAYRAVGEEARGYVYSSKLDNAPGDQVTFFAYGDSEYTDEGNIYYKFDHWADADGNEVSREREFTVTVKGMEIYYAHFVQTTKTEFRETETIPDVFKYDYNNRDWNGDWNGIETVSVHQSASSDAFYDLQGRRVAQPRQGLYIHNGKKMVVR